MMTISQHAGPRPATTCLNVTSEHDGHRLDQYLGEALRQRGLSREKAKAMIRDGLVLVNGRVEAKPNLRLAAGDRVELELDGLPSPDAPLAPERGELAILHADEQLIVLNKPAGLTVHPAPGLPVGTLANRLAHRFPALAGLGGERPGIVHRIDKDTSGLLVVALTEEARLALSEAFAEREVFKEYLALVHGVPERPEDVVDQAIGRHPTIKTRMAVVRKGGKPARSAYRTLFADPGGRYGLLAVRIYTGRTHQIRVHLTHLGLPIIGDAVYGSRHALAELPQPLAGLALKLAGRQLLHAWRLGFAHPAGGERLFFQQPPPRDFAQAALLLARTPQRTVVTGMPGCGKSTLLGYLEERGMPAFSADRCVAELYQPGGDAWQMLRRQFGAQYLRDGGNGPVDKPALFAAMLESDALRREVEAFVHPMVRHRLGEFWQAQAGRRAAAAEIPLFLETGSRGAQWSGMADALVGVRCPAGARHERLRCRGLSEAHIAGLESWQWPEERKLAACDMVADNATGLDELRGEAVCILGELAARRRDAARRLAERLGGLWNQSCDAAGTATPCSP